MCTSAPRKGWRPNKKRPKQAWRSKSNNSVRPVHVPHRPERNNMSPHLKYANTGCKAKSFHGLTVMARLQNLQSQLNALRSTIHRKPCVMCPSRFKSTTCLSGQLQMSTTDGLRGSVEIFSHELHESHRGTHVRDIEHD